jgi:hypothetical protein
MEEQKIQDLYIKLITINNILRNLDQDDLLFTEDDWNIIKILLKR